MMSDRLLTIRLGLCHGQRCRPPPYESDSGATRRCAPGRFSWSCPTSVKLPDYFTPEEAAALVDQAPSGTGSRWRMRVMLRTGLLVFRPGVASRPTISDWPCPGRTSGDAPDRRRAHYRVHPGPALVVDAGSECLSLKRGPPGRWQVVPGPANARHPRRPTGPARPIEPERG